MTTCTCRHAEDWHGRADAQTAWQRICQHPDCDCEDYQAEPDIRDHLRAASARANALPARARPTVLPSLRLTPR